MVRFLIEVDSDGMTNQQINDLLNFTDDMMPDDIKMILNGTKIIQDKISIKCTRNRTVKIINKKKEIETDEY